MTNYSGKANRFLCQILLFCAIFSSSFAQQTGTIRGTVKDEISQESLVGVSVRIVNSENGTLTNDQGEFVFEAVPVGRLELEISSVGYKKQVIKELILVSGKDLVIAINLKSAITDLGEVQVKAPGFEREQTSISRITTEQVMRLPATFFDPMRLAFSYAGTANVNDQANGVSVRGNDPATLQWRLEGLEIVNPNHLANAGTFSDQPSASAGGTNMLSAQMLGNSNFLTGAFAAEYGNVIGGIMDMQLRDGNNENHEKTVQAGLIGVDLSAEGPLNKLKGSSYLFNYRYSFTGLLALGGITFGGESIKFQDLSFKLSFPSQKLGKVSVFAMGGNNSNDFKFSDEEGLGPQSEKDFSLINYQSKMGLVGMTQEKTLSPKLHWRNAIIWSGLENQRLQAANQELSSSFTRLSQQDNTTERISFSSIFNSKIGLKADLKAGAYINSLKENFYQEEAVNFDRTSLIIQPFVQYHGELTKNIAVTLGLHQANYIELKKSTIEPRANVSVKLNALNDLNFAFGRHSQYYNGWNTGLNLLLKPALSNQFVANYVYNNQMNQVKAEVFYQLNSGLTAFFDRLKIGNFYQDEAVYRGDKGRNYGLELSYQKYLSRGFYALLNTTLYKSQYETVDGAYVDGKYGGNYIVNATVGKEWNLKKSRQLGVNTRIVNFGGFRDYAIDLAASAAQKTTVYNYTAGLTKEYPAYFRTDLRVYLKKSKNNRNTMWSLDLQNLSNQQNVAYDYYDNFLGDQVRKYQLGMIPMLNYRIEF